MRVSSPSYYRIYCVNVHGCATVHARAFSINIGTRAYVHACTISINSHTISGNVCACASASIRAHASANILALTSVCLFVYERASARIHECGL